MSQNPYEPPEAPPPSLLTGKLNLRDRSWLLLFAAIFVFAAEVLTLFFQYFLEQPEHARALHLTGLLAFVLLGWYFRGLLLWGAGFYLAGFSILLAIVGLMILEYIDPEKLMGEYSSVFMTSGIFIVLGWLVSIIGFFLQRKQARVPALMIGITFVVLIRSLSSALIPLFWNDSPMVPTMASVFYGIAMTTLLLFLWNTQRDGPAAS